MPNLRLTHPDGSESLVSLEVDPEHQGDLFIKTKMTQDSVVKTDLDGELGQLTITFSDGSQLHHFAK